MRRYEHHLFICTNERAVDDERGSCARRGSAALLDRARERCHAAGLKARVRVNGVGCLNACAQGPTAVVYGAANPADGVWYALCELADVDAVVDEHLEHGVPVARLLR
jgi:(2Fe-2S) ferredoxin